MATDVAAYTVTTWVPDAAPGISAAQLQRMDDQVDSLSTEFNIHNGGILLSDHPEVTGSVRGFMRSADKSKLDLLNYETEQPQDVGATRAVGGDTDVSRGDHRHRIADARLVAVVGGTIRGVPSTSPGVAWNTRLGADIARPTSWGSCLVQVTGHVLYAKCGVGDQFSMRVRVDSSTGPENQSGVTAEDEEQNVAAQHTVVTADSTIDIDLEVIRNGTHTGTGKYITFNYLLIRAT